MKFIQPLLLICCSVMPKFGVSKELRRVILGGYQDAEPTNERAMNAASFAVSSICLGSSEQGAYSFAGALMSYNEKVQSGLLEDGGELSMQILKVKEQVVAGMNYDMTIEVKLGENCLGAFRVTVWDQFGDLEVTNWGKEVPCSLESESTELDEEDLS